MNKIILIQKLRLYSIGKEIIRIAAILIIATLIILPLNQPIEIYNENHYIVVGDSQGVISSIILDYQDYFNAQIINKFPKNKIDLIIVFAHGSLTDDKTKIILQLKNEIILLTGVNADRVIWISCGVGIIDDLDPNTKHYSYSIFNEEDKYYFRLNITNQVVNGIELIGWATFFLELIKTGLDWDVAEIQARNMTDEYFKSNGETIESIK